MDNMIGHNRPSAFEVLKDRCEALVGTANRWLAERPEIQTEDEAAKCTDFINQLRAELKEAKDKHKAEKAPFLTAGRGIDDKYRPITTLLDMAVNALKPKMTAWIQKLEFMKQQAARKAEEEALAALQEAEDARTDTIQGMVAQQEAEAQAEAKMKEADKLASSRAQSRGQFGGPAMSLRTQKVAVIIDQNAVYRHFRNDRQVKDLLQRLANAEVRAKREVPGTETKDERSAA